MNRYPHAVGVSAKTREGFEQLHAVVSNALSRTFRNVDIILPVQDGKLLAYLAAKGEILSTQYDEEKVTVHCRIPQKHLGRIENQDITINDRAKPMLPPAADLNEASLYTEDNRKDDGRSVDDVA